jgi:hypothetical protein
MERSKNYLGTVCNDETGWELINNVKKFFKVRLRGRHPDRKGVYQEVNMRQNKIDFPIYLSERIAIYKKNA